LRASTRIVLAPAFSTAAVNPFEKSVRGFAIQISISS
jgi:hypothetical protein